MATRTHPDQWATTDSAMVATVLAVLEERNRRKGSRR